MVSKREGMRIRKKQELETFFGGLQKNTGKKVQRRKIWDFQTRKKLWIHHIRVEK